MFVHTVRETIYSIEEKLPKEREVVLVLIDDELQDYHTQWFRGQYLKLPLRFHWEPAEFLSVSFGYPNWGKLNISSYGATFSQYITHWKYITPPPEELRGKEFQ